MKKSLLTIIAAAFAGMAAFFGGTASAGQYPVAPPGTYITLQLSSFIQSVPSQSSGLPVPNPVIGDHLGQHPGAFSSGQPPVGAYFVGVFAGLIDTSDPGTGVYLWETTGPGLGGGAGPQIQLGHWDGTAFSAYGSPQAASYSGTGVLEDVGGGMYYEIYSSFTLLSAFGISPGAPLCLNAVRIEATVNAHNQVTAVAVVPEPSFTLGILSQPVATSAGVGGQAAFGVGATGAQPIIYQWRFHGTNSAGTPGDISGATNATYTINNVQSTNAGWYSVRVSNPCGSLDSTPALLTVLPVCVSVDLYVGLNLTGGVPGRQYHICSAPSLTEPVTWTTNATITQTVPGVLWIETNSPANKPQKYYRVTE
jgi:hypothetical protein